MTFQVVIVGSDGLIVGSDRKMHTVLPSFRGDRSFTQFDEQTKFFTEEGRAVICACSGGLESQRLARQIVSSSDPNVSDLEWQSHLDSLARESRVIGFHQLIVVRTSHFDHAFWLVMGERGYASRINTEQCVGVQSSACFLTGQLASKRPIQELKRLALLTMSYAADEFPTSVGEGYDLMTLTDLGIEWNKYSADDERVLSIRRSFEDAVKSVIYPINS